MSDRGGVAAQVGAQREGPPQDLGVIVPLAASTSSPTMGLIVATYGMLSTIADSAAGAPSSSTVAGHSLPSTAPVAARAGVSMTPVATRAPTITNRPAKKMSVGHSTS